MLPDNKKMAIGKELKRLAKEDKAKLQEIMSKMSPQEQTQIAYDWSYWARDKQIIRDYHEGWPEPIIVFCGGRGAGKLFSPNTDIYTQNKGWIKFGEIVNGDIVFDEHGKPCNVIGVYEPDKKDIGKLYKLTFSDGTSVDTCGDHLWATLTHSDRDKSPEDWAAPHTVKTTSEIINTFMYDGKPNHSIPATKPLVLPREDFGIDPFILGTQLRDLDIIPNVFWKGDIEQRTAILEGVVGKDNHYVARNKEHADYMFWLVSSLGYIPTWSRSDQYKFTWSYDTNLRLISRYDEIEYQEGMRCITVDSPNSMYLITKSLIPTHNTRTAAEWVRHKVKQRDQYILLIGPTASKVRDVMVSGILEVHPPTEKPEYKPSYSSVNWANSIGQCISAEEPDRIRGANSSLVWIDELGEIFDPDVFDQSMLTLRRGESRILITTTPRLGNPTLLNLYNRAVFNYDPPQEGKDVRFITDSTYSNIDNLSSTFKNQILTSYSGTRLERQEIHGEMLFEQEGALWTSELIIKQTVSPDFKPPSFQRVCIGVDPAVSTTKKSDNTGIVVSGLGDDDNAYVIKDLTGKYQPSEWPRIVIQEYEYWSQICPVEIVVERNQGGDLVKSTLEREKSFLNVSDVFHTRSKIVRAEPVAAQYERGKVWHMRGLEELEKEMCIYAGLPRQPSPDRLDAMVMSMTRLILTNKTYTKVSEILF